MAAPPQRTFIRSVLDGSTVVLKGGALLSLAGVTAPRLGNAKEPGREEPFAYACREQLRKLLVGREVAYAVEYTVPSGRDFGRIELAPAAAIDGERSVARILVKQGWLKTRAEGARAKTEEQQKLAELEAAAQAAKLGVWGDAEAGRRTVNYELPSAKEFADTWKGKELDAVIEQVRDGSTARMTLQLGPGEYQVCAVQLAGIRCPAFRRGVPNVEDLVEPFGEEAQQFFEIRLLQRDVKVRIAGAPPQGSVLVCEVIHPRGDIAEALVSEGLARTVDWTIAMTKEPAKLRQAEAKAKERRVRIWKDHVPRASRGEFSGTVLRVVSGECIIVEGPDGKERKVWLASVRIPRPEGAPPPGPEARGREPTGWAAEAKEYLRTRLIGKNVHVKLDYTKQPQEGAGPAEEREAATVTAGSTNVAEALVARGLATVIRHRRDDEDRSSAYDALLVAEAKAKEAGKGAHGGKEPPQTRWSDASESAAKAKQFLPFLSRSKSIPAVVEHVANAGRFRILVPKESTRLTLVLGGIRAPRVARAGTTEKTEPFGKEALEFVSRRCLQRDVEIEVEGTDKVGGFIGVLKVPPADPKSGEPALNIGVALLREGLASVNEYSANQSTHAREYFDAEKAAKAAKAGIWSLEGALDEEEPADPAGGELEQHRWPRVVVSEIVSGSEFFCQVVEGDYERELNELMGKLKVACAEEAEGVAAAWMPRAGDLVAAKFSGDGQWYRARVRKVNPGKTVSLLYVDFGNAEELPVSPATVRKLPADLSSRAAMARECRLAFIRVPGPDEDYGEDAYDLFRSQTEGKELAAVAFGRPGAKVHEVVLYDPARVKSAGAPLDAAVKKSVNAEVLREGLGTLSKDANRRLQEERRKQQQAAKAGQAAWNGGGPKSELEVLDEAQEEARKGRRNLWRFGDAFGDDEAL
ncbi:hypothetical protein DFJ74DRAFT_621755 [Hyaloraphidium curvatum]|nr:hypothetical protein DFJ74DRAFT_621755 [Hyaloraphidium curvatum]